MKKILVMDDDGIVGDVACRMLQILGFDARYVSDGKAAVVEYVQARESGSPFDAVILDLNVAGGMGGRKAAADILAVDREAVLFVSSGSTTDPVVVEFRQYGFAGFLPKPFTLTDLQTLFLDGEYAVAGKEVWLSA